MISTDKIKRFDPNFVYFYSAGANYIGMVKGIKEQYNRRHKMSIENYVVVSNWFNLWVVSGVLLTFLTSHIFQAKMDSNGCRYSLGRQTPKRSQLTAFILKTAGNNFLRQKKMNKKYLRETYPV